MAWSSSSLMLERGTEGVSYENHKYLQYVSGTITHVCIISCLAKGITGKSYIVNTNTLAEYRQYLLLPELITVR